MSAQVVYPQHNKADPRGAEKIPINLIPSYPVRPLTIRMAPCDCSLPTLTPRSGAVAVPFRGGEPQPRAFPSQAPRGAADGWLEHHTLLRRRALEGR
eukprot:SAG11_NODE_2765_length_2998_cov_7.305278_2_plen_97_part_00